MNTLELFLFMIIYKIIKKKEKKVINRVKILNDFENLLNIYNFNFENKHRNNVILSNDKLLLRLQMLLIDKINNLNDHNNFKKIMLNDINEYNFNGNVYEALNLWMGRKYNI